MGQSPLNKLLTEGVRKVAAFNKAKREIEQWDNKFRAYFKGQINPPHVCPKCGDEVAGDEDGLCQGCV